MKKNALSLLFSLSLVAGLNAQYNAFDRTFEFVPCGAWTVYTSLYQTTHRDYLISTDVADTTGGVYDQYYQFFKTNREGTPLWGKRIHKGVLTDSISITGNSILQTSDNGLLLGTCEYDGNYAHPQIVLVKTDSVGTVLWSKKYPGLGISRLFCVKQTADSGFVVCGSTTEPTHVQWAYVFKTDANGNFLWGKRVLSSGSVWANFNSVVELPGQGYVCAGSTGQTALAVEVDLNGNVIWSKNIFDHWGIFDAVLLTSDNSLVFGGSRYDSTVIYPYACLLKTDLSGNLIWEKGCQPTSSFYSGSYVWSLSEMYPGIFAFAGYVADPIPATYLGTADMNGNIQWCKEYHSTFHSFNYTPLSVLATVDGGFALATLSGTYSGPANVYSIAFLKTFPAGDVSCDGVDFPIAFAPLNFSFTSNNLIFPCDSTLPYSAVLLGIPVDDSLLCQTILDPDPTGIKEWSVSSFELNQNVPNPFSDQTTISYQLNSLGENVVLEIYDVRGVNVFEKTEHDLQAGTYSIALDKSNFSSGIYFYSLTVDGKRMVKKMVVE